MRQTNMNFKLWLENFIKSQKYWSEMGHYPGADPLKTPDMSRRPDLIRGGLSTCDPDMPMGMKPMFEPTTSAFPTYSLPNKQQKSFSARGKSNNSLRNGQIRRPTHS